MSATCPTRATPSTTHATGTAHATQATRAPRRTHATAAARAPRTARASARLALAALLGLAPLAACGPDDATTTRAEPTDPRAPLTLEALGALHATLDALVDRGALAEAEATLDAARLRAPAPELEAIDDGALLRDLDYRAATIALSAGHAEAARAHAQRGLARGGDEDVTVASLHLLHARAAEALGDRDAAAEALAAALDAHERLLEEALDD